MEAAQKPQAHDDLAQLKKAAEVYKGFQQQAQANQINWGGNGVYIAPSSGTTTSYSANTLVSR